MSAHRYELLQRRAEECPDAVAIGGQQGLIWKTLTGRQLLARVDVVGAGQSFGWPADAGSLDQAIGDARDQRLHLEHDRRARGA
jgi:hypothetical protein